MSQLFLIHHNQKKKEKETFNWIASKDYSKNWKWWKLINKEIFKKYFTYENPSVLAKYLYEQIEAKNEQKVNKVNDALIDFKNDVNKTAIPETRNPNKIFYIFKKTLQSNKQ